MPTRADLIDLVYDCPADIAVKLGYDKLTDLHNKWIKDMVFGTEDETIQAHRGSFKTTCLHISFAFILVLFPGERAEVVGAVHEGVDDGGVHDVLPLALVPAVAATVVAPRVEPCDGLGGPVCVGGKCGLLSLGCHAFTPLCFALTMERASAL